MHKHLKYALIYAIISIFILISSILYVKLNLINENQIKSSQFLLANVSYSTERQTLLLFCRDQIKFENSSISLDEAYNIASIIVKYSEIYPRIDPLMWLSLQSVESKFNKNAISSKNAVGINQVLALNARLLCKAYGITYSDSMLFNIEINTRFAAQIFDDAMSEYQNIEIALAAYNGGVYNAINYKQNKKALSIETADYIPQVMKKWENYKNLFKNYKLDINKLISK